MNGCLIGKAAPHFKAKAVVQDRILEDFSLTNFLGQYVVFFFYPLDFTFVCPTELHAFQAALEEFKTETLWLLVLLVTQTRYTSHGYLLQKIWEESKE